MDRLFTLTRYFTHLVQEPWGFATAHRLTFQTTLPDRLFSTPAARLPVLERILGELRAAPGVTSATVTLPHPLNSAYRVMNENPEGTTPPSPRGFRQAYLRGTVPGYFATAGLSLLEGRDFTDADRGDTEPVCIVNAGFARRFWPGQDAIGKRVKMGRLDESRPGSRSWASLLTPRSSRIPTTARWTARSACR